MYDYAKVDSYHTVRTYSCLPAAFLREGVFLLVHDRGNCGPVDWTKGALADDSEEKGFVGLVVPD